MRLYSNNGCMFVCFNTQVKYFQLTSWPVKCLILFFFPSRQHTGVSKTQKQLKGKGKSKKRLRSRRWPPLHLEVAGWGSVSTLSLVQAIQAQYSMLTQCFWFSFSFLSGRLAEHPKNPDVWTQKLKIPLWRIAAEMMRQEFEPASDFFQYHILNVLMSPALQLSAQPETTTSRTLPSAVANLYKLLCPVQGRDTFRFISKH